MNSYKRLAKELTKDREDSGRPSWNFYFEFDSDVECPATNTLCPPLSTYAYEVSTDTNPTINTNWVTYEPINVQYAYHNFAKIDATEDTDLVEAPDANSLTNYANVTS